MKLTEGHWLRNLLDLVDHPEVFLGVSYVESGCSDYRYSPQVSAAHPLPPTMLQNILQPLAPTISISKYRSDTGKSVFNFAETFSSFPAGPDSGAVPQHTQALPAEHRAVQAEIGPTANTASQARARGSTGTPISFLHPLIFYETTQRVPVAHSSLSF